jgi:hypothetical protein
MKQCGHKLYCKFSSYWRSTCGFIRTHEPRDHGVIGILCGFVELPTAWKRCIIYPAACAAVVSRSQAVI